MADLSRDEAKALRAELADLLGYYPASLAPDDGARYRKEAAGRPAEAPRRTHRWNHLKEEKRQRDAEARGRAEVADLSVAHDDRRQPL